MHVVPALRQAQEPQVEGPPHHQATRHCERSEAIYVYLPKIAFFILFFQNFVKI